MILMIRIYVSCSGGERDYLRRALLIYDGIHYDPLVVEGAEGTVVQRLFPTDSDAVLVQALEMAKDAYDVSTCQELL